MTYIYKTIFISQDINISRFINFNYSSPGFLQSINSSYHRESRGWNWGRARGGMSRFSWQPIFAAGSCYPTFGPDRSRGSKVNGEREQTFYFVSIDIWLRNSISRRFPSKKEATRNIPRMHRDRFFFFSISLCGSHSGRVCVRRVRIRRHMPRGRRTHDAGDHPILRHRRPHAWASPRIAAALSPLPSRPLIRDDKAGATPVRGECR